MLSCLSHLLPLFFSLSLHHPSLRVIELIICTICLISCNSTFCFWLLESRDKEKMKSKTWKRKVRWLLWFPLCLLIYKAQGMAAQQRNHFIIISTVVDVQDLKVACFLYDKIDNSSSSHWSTREDFFFFLFFCCTYKEKDKSIIFFFLFFFL